MRTRSQPDAAPPVVHVVSGLIVVAASAVVVVDRTPVATVMVALTIVVAVAALTAVVTTRWQSAVGGLVFLGWILTGLAAFRLGRDSPSAAPLAMVLLYVPVFLWLHLLLRRGGHASARSTRQAGHRPGDGT
jgi:hypothetical protein